MNLINGDMDRIEAQVERAERAMADAIWASMSGTDADARVRQLRASVLGDKAGPAMVGLDEATRRERV